MEKKDTTQILELLEYIDPAVLDYGQWLSVGMALAQEGYTAVDWANWSRRDPARYHEGECERKWSSFNGSEAPVTGGTIVQMAKDAGWRPELQRELDWDDEIEYDGDSGEIEAGKDPEKELYIPTQWNPVQQLITYIDALFESTDLVGYVTRATKGDGARVSPSKGCWDRTAGQLIEQLSRCEGDIGAVLGDYNPEVGAWIRFNPLDGHGIKNTNVADFRYTLVESDKISLSEQNAIIHSLELPVAALVYSGGKSLHAVVKVDACDIKQYQQRVEYLYKICDKNGFEVDRANRNPSRLSRMPGVMRNGRKQYLLGTNLGMESWDKWVEWIETECIDDGLPAPKNLADIWGSIPELSPPLIDGVLRQGHKMLFAGPSKAGKSFALIELCCAIAEGREWLGFKCTQGRVMYVNLELEEASCWHRISAVYSALGWPPANINNLTVWNLRGLAMPMDKLVPSLVQRANKLNCIAIVIDPIYKVITGDENSADQMAHFCNQFDKICTQLHCAVIYCHHHSKGAQGGKRSMDRASGSGVFARDPDALLDLIELELTDDVIKQEENSAVCKVCLEWLKRFGVDGEVSQDDTQSQKAMIKACQQLLKPNSYGLMMREVTARIKAVKSVTAWRIDGTLREFPKFPPIDVYFDYPIHRVDTTGILSDLESEIEKPMWQQATEKRQKQAEKSKERKQDDFEIEFSNLEIDGAVSAQELAEKLDMTSKALLRWLGDTKRQNESLKEEFEKFLGEDGKMYIRRKETE